MKYLYSLSLTFLLISLGCEETTIYETDPRLYNDAFHGSIIGKIKQTSIPAIVIVSQVNPVDTAEVNVSDGSFETDELPIGNYDVQIIAENYRIHKENNIKVTGAGTTYIGEIELSTIPDHISRHYPEKDSEIVYNNNYSRLSVSITFEKPMDRNSVEEAFSTYPQTEGTFYWERQTTQPQQIYFYSNGSAYSDPGTASAEITTFKNINSFTYTMTQKDSYVDTTYYISLSTEAKDTLGAPLRFPLNFHFRTVQSSSTQNAIITSPSRGDMNVDLISYNGIRIIFPRNMNKESVESAISITPCDDPVFIWPDNNILTIYTGGVFYAGTTYSITIDSTAEDLDGILLGVPFSFSFSTSKVEVERTSPRNGELFVDLCREIDLVFNTYIVLSTLKNNFTITPNISGTLQYQRYNSAKNSFEFIPNGTYQPNTKYTITIKEGVEDLFGSNLQEDYKFSFLTRP